MVLWDSRIWPRLWRESRILPFHNRLKWEYEGLFSSTWIPGRNSRLLPRVVSPAPANQSRPQMLPPQSWNRPLQTHRSVSIISIPCSRICMPIDWKPFVDLVHRHQRFLLTTHVRPDGDGIGSILALGDALRQMGKEVRLV